MKRAFPLLALAIAVAMVGWWLAGRRGFASLPAASCRGCNLLLVTIDTLRADRVGAYGSAAGLTPALDRLAGDGVRFARAYSAAPLTLPSHTSILTGVSPPVHGVRANGIFRLGPGSPTLATVLHDAGYRTGAFVGSFVLDARFGLNRGFDVYDDRYGEKHEGDPVDFAERRAEEVTKPALEWITAAPGTPWLAWIHLYDPHDPYRAPEPYASRYQPYDAEVAYTDAMLGKMLDALRERGQLDHTLVIVAADHGESLGEHNERTHGVFTYDVTMRVPWIVWSGSRLRPGVVDRVVRLIDLLPTALDLLGIAAPAQLEGRPAASAEERSAYFEAMDANLTRNWAPLTGLVRGSWKLIELPRPELYDVEKDPSEQTNLFEKQPEQARTLSALLRDTSATLASRATGAQQATLSAEAQQRLQALGYTASSADPSQRVYTDADDPKTLIGPANELQHAFAQFAGGDRAAAMAAVRSIAQQHPRFTTAFGMLATMQRQSGDLRGAIATLDDTVRRGIADPSVMVVLAGYLQEAGEGDKAIKLLEAVIAGHPDYAEAYNSLGVVNMRLGRHDQARAALQRVLDLDPTSAKAYENLGADKLAARDIAGAVPDLQHAVELDPKLFDALYNLGLALATLGRDREARPYLERFAAEAPPARYAQDIAQVRSVLASRAK